MTISSEWVAFDTNVWIFGIRRQPEKPACGELLEHLTDLHVYITFQVIRELQANLTDQERSYLFQLIARFPQRVNVDWERVEDFRYRWFMKFIVTIEQDEDGIYIAECLSIPGCISQGNTREEALKNIKDAIHECLEVRAERDMPLTITM